MKKKFLFIPLAASMLLAACSINLKDDVNDTTNNTVVDLSDFSTDGDPVKVIEDGGTTNEYDDDSFVETPVDTPNEYTGTNVETISTAGNYYFTGEVSPINITAKKNSVVYLFFNGVTINNNEGIALASENKIVVYLVLQDGSVNTITNDFEDTNAIHIKGDLHILGSGTLNVESKQKNGVKASKDLYISGSELTLNVTGANHAITARSLTANDATINVVANGKDGIQLEVDSDATAFTTEQGYAKLTNVKFTGDTKGDGIQANTFVYISGGTYNITTHGEFVNYTTSNVSTYELETDDFKYVKSGDTYKRVAKDEIRSLNSNYYALTQSVKGIKVSEIEITDENDVTTSVTTGDYDIYVAHGAKITVNSTDDCIHSNYGDVTIEESNLYLATYDDGVHADYNLNVNNSHIEVSASYEGLEGAVVTIDGEDSNLVIYASDDGINAASDLSSTNNIYIKNGYTRVYASGDGLDANTGLYLQGGTVVVEGPGSGNGSLDADKVYFQGGIVFACSTNGMRESMTATQNAFIYQGSKMNAGSTIKVVDSDGNELYTYALKQSCTQLIFSHPSLTIGKTYKIMNGSSTVATINQTSALTNVGSSGGGGQGGPGGHR